MDLSERFQHDPSDYVPILIDEGTGPCGGLDFARIKLEHQDRASTVSRIVTTTKKERTFQKPPIACAVCGESAGYHHYDAASCNGCKCR